MRSVHVRSKESFKSLPFQKGGLKFKIMVSAAFGIRLNKRAIGKTPHTSFNTYGKATDTTNPVVFEFNIKNNGLRHPRRLLPADSMLFSVLEPLWKVHKHRKTIVIICGCVLS